MKKIDLHIHTKPTDSDADFTFSLDKLKEYTQKLKIDCIAITNHNTFDLVQFENISNELSIYVLPGIEIDLEGGHLLLISEKIELTDFNSKCQKIQKLVSSKNFISTLQLKEVFKDLSKYLLIPHYEKNPKIDSKSLSELGEYISAGEVASPKKFEYCFKNSSSLVPVLFSDLRITEDLMTFSTRQTYLNLNVISLSGIKTCLMDKNKVFLSKRKDKNLFQVLEDGLELSTGLNVVLGERSSGKTHLLKEINRLHNINNNVKFITQFSLVETDEEKDIKKFNELLSTGQNDVSESYLKEIKNIIDDVAKIDIKINNKKVENYLESLFKNAFENEKTDSFSNSKMFNETLYNEIDYSNLNKLVEATVYLIKNNEYREIIDKHVKISNLKELAIELMSIYTEGTEKNIKKIWINELTTNIKKGLRLKTALTPIEDIDLYKIKIDNLKIERFNQIIKLLKKEKEITQKEVRGFRVVASTEKFIGASGLKEKSKQKIPFTDAFKKYESPFEYLEELKLLELLKDSEYYKYFVDIKYKILNKHGYEVSGGERSEFNLLHKLEDASKYDMLLIDEPESSFDNIFLKNEVNSLIRDISKSIPVVVVTHNNTVGASIKPDYLICTKKETNHGIVEHKIFSGYFSDKKLKSPNGDIINNYEIMLDCLEAGSEAYKDRKKSYEILKD